MTSQDRRITKTRKAIYTAFLQLLNKKSFETITVQEVIDLADVGRSTFYSHYESKELLLDELFLRQLQKELEHHVYPMVAEDLKVSYPKIPASYLKHFVVSNFIETLTWWLKKGKSYKEDQVVRFYLDVMEMTNKQK